YFGYIEAGFAEGTALGEQAAGRDAARAGGHVVGGPEILELHARFAVKHGAESVEPAAGAGEDGEYFGGLRGFDSGDERLIGGLDGQAEGHFGAVGDAAVGGPPDEPGEGGDGGEVFGLVPHDISLRQLCRPRRRGGAIRRQRAMGTRTPPM